MMTIYDRSEDAEEVRSSAKICEIWGQRPLIQKE